MPHALASPPSSAALHAGATAAQLRVGAQGIDSSVLHKQARYWHAEPRGPVKLESEMNAKREELRVDRRGTAIPGTRAASAQPGDGVVAVLPFRRAEPVFSVQHAPADAAQGDIASGAAGRDGSGSEGAAPQCGAGTLRGGAGG